MVLNQTELKELLEDVVDALSNKRLLQKRNKDVVGVEITSHIIDRCKDALSDLEREGE
ncbi:MAG TPA: hypothetical protein VFM18_14055 [Methanosarcina sp.]|nr:hypothetical protein [Methanosarcina sp.]